MKPAASPAVIRSSMDYIEDHSGAVGGGPQ